MSPPRIPEGKPVESYSEDIAELQNGHGRLVAEFSELRKTVLEEIGTVPDPTRTSCPDGSGLKGLLVEVLQRLETLSVGQKQLAERVDKIAEVQSQKPQKPWDWLRWLAIVLLIVSSWLRPELAPILSKALDPAYASQPTSVR